MATLSDYDYRKKLGKDIVISNFKKDTIHGSLVSVTVGDMAWSVVTNESGKVVVNSIKANGVISVPPNGRALIITDESLYLNNKLTGTCHSRVSMVASGWGHIGTVIMPESVGPLLITIHNSASKAIDINNGDEIAVIKFEELATKAKKKTQSQRELINDRTRLLREAGIQLTQDEQEILTFSVMQRFDDVKQEMENNAHYLDFKKDYKKIPWSWSSKFFFASCSVLAIGVIWGIVNLVRGVTDGASLQMPALLIALSAGIFALLQTKRIK